MGVEAAQLIVASAESGPEQREASYAAIEGVVRGAPSSDRSGGGGEKRSQAVELAVACVRPLIADVLCAPASKVGRQEYVRASVLVYEMLKVDMMAVVAEAWRKDDEGATPFLNTWTAPDTVLASMLAMEPCEWTRDDALVTAANFAIVLPMWAVGMDGCLGSDAVHELWDPLWGGPGGCPLLGDPPPEGYTRDHYIPLALLLLDLVRSELDTPEGVIAGAWICMHHMAQMSQASSSPQVAQALSEAGFLDVYLDTMQHYNPMERIGKHNLIPSGAIVAYRAVIDGVKEAGVDVIQTLLDAEALDIAISCLHAYQMLGKPEQASVCGVWYGGLTTLETLLASAQATPIVTDKLRSAGVESFRYLLDHPLVQVAALGLETGVSATTITAQVRVTLPI
eukprot:COSAG02_NODE_1506_length_12232_cov_420.616088_18_plen_396_part_00